jgi:hypothetical protein
MIPTWTYVKGKDGIYVNLFIGSTINVEKVAGIDVEMVQKTDYPWNGSVAITVNPKQTQRFSVFVRVPNRTTSELYTPTPQVNGLMSLSVNGSPVVPKVEKGYAVINREWKAGDKIELELPLQVQRIKASDRIVADRGLVALRYGPLIYNAERADQPDIDRPVDSHAALTTEWKGDLLDGVVIVRGSFADGSPFIAIPNYARNNRNSSTPRASAGGDATIDYSGGAAASAGGTRAATNANASASAATGRSRGSRGVSTSMVWLKDQVGVGNTNQPPPAR